MIAEILGPIAGAAGLLMLSIGYGYVRTRRRSRLRLSARGLAARSAGAACWLIGIAGVLRGLNEPNLVLGVASVAWLIISWFAFDVLAWRLENHGFRDST